MSQILFNERDCGAGEAFVALAAATIQFNAYRLAFQKIAQALPKLDRKKTWFMAKRDLESAGIPYKTEEGFADFHAAGRASFITGLLQSGATLT